MTEEVPKHVDDDDRDLVKEDGTPFDQYERYAFFHDAKFGYIVKRQNEYPRLEEQLDLIFHKGVEGWKAEIQVIKEKYPKPE